MKWLSFICFLPLNLAAWIKVSVLSSLLGSFPPSGTADDIVHVLGTQVQLGNSVRLLAPTAPFDSHYPVQTIAAHWMQIWRLQIASPLHNCMLEWIWTLRDTILSAIVRYIRFGGNELLDSNKLGELNGLVFSILLVAIVVLMITWHASIH